MPFAIASVIFIMIYTILLFIYPGRTEAGLKHPGRAIFTSIAIRCFILCCLLSVPALAHVSGLFNSLKLAYYSEAAMTLVSLLLFATGLFSLLQRLMAIRFKMDPVFEMPEIIFMTAFPAILYAAYILTDWAAIYYISPGLYAIYLLFNHAYRKKPGNIS